MTDRISTNTSRSVQRLFFPEDGLDLPFTVTNAPGEVMINLNPRAMRDPLLVDPRAYSWIAGVCGRVLVDVSRIQQVNSSSCSWLINLMLAAKPAPVAVIRANPQVREAFKRLKLTELIRVDG
jgi:hypothetical protein